MLLSKITAGKTSLNGSMVEPSVTNSGCYWPVCVCQVSVWSEMPLVSSDTPGKDSFSLGFIISKFQWLEDFASTYLIK